MSAVPKVGLLAAALLLSGCGKELGRVPFTGESTSGTSAVLSAGRVDFWTDLDIAYVGSGSLEYHIALVQGGTPVATASCDALGQMPLKVGWVEIDLPSGHTRKGSGRMSCSANLPKGGATTVEAALAFGARPTSALIRKADLVIKQ